MSNSSQNISIEHKVGNVIPLLQYVIIPALICWSVFTERSVIYLQLKAVSGNALFAHAITFFIVILLEYGAYLFITKFFEYTLRGYLQRSYDWVFMAVFGIAMLGFAGGKAYLSVTNAPNISRHLADSNESLSRQTIAIDSINTYYDARAAKYDRSRRSREGLAYHESLEKQKDKAALSSLAAVNTERKEAIASAKFHNEEVAARTKIDQMDMGTIFQTLAGFGELFQIIFMALIIFYFAKLEQEKNENEGSSSKPITPHKQANPSPEPLHGMLNRGAVKPNLNGMHIQNERAPIGFRTASPPTTERKPHVQAETVEIQHVQAERSPSRSAERQGVNVAERTERTTIILNETDVVSGDIQRLRNYRRRMFGTGSAALVNKHKYEHLRAELQDKGITVKVNPNNEKSLIIEA